MGTRHAAILSMLAATALACGPAFAQSHTEPRARDLGVPFDGTPGPLNAIIDVAGVEVGYKTLISGEGPLVVGKGPVRTGVTAILPRGKQGTKSVFAGYFAGNGNGDMTGTHWIEESGLLETPILITNTGSVGVVRDAAVAWMVQRKRPGDFWYPVTAETADVALNDLKGQHVTAQDAWDALNSATAGPLLEGNVGGGTGMICNGFKGGTGTSSRRLEAAQGGYTVGVLVQCNYGESDQLRVAGIAVAREMNLREPCVEKLLNPPVLDDDGKPAPLCDRHVATTADGMRAPEEAPSS
jgi:D-aminopeptidase